MNQSETDRTPVAKPKRNSMARRALDTLTELRRRMFITPAESAAAARKQIDEINLGLAEQRAQLRAATLALIQERSRTNHREIELKLTINRVVLENSNGNQAMIEIATEIARRLIERHRAMMLKK